jgi:hypothetical protein
MSTSYVQFNGDFSEVESKYTSLSLWADGDHRVYFEEDGERHYLENGDYVVLRGGKHVVETSEPKEDKPKAAKKPEAKTEPKANTSGPDNEETEMRPAEGSATTDDRK